MKHLQTWLVIVVFMNCAPALADNANDPFQEVVQKYLAANPKPALPEEARKYKVQAEFALQEKKFFKAAKLYGRALEIAPWWPEGRFNRALILGDTKKYWEAMREMKRYLLLAPNASNARAAQDKIYQWESVAGPAPVPAELVTFRDCTDCPEMVTVSRSFAIGKTEVTQGQWQALMGNKPNKFSNCGPDCPVEQINWKDAQEFIQKLNQKTGKQYRLPSEAEWEYACRAGGQQEYCGSDSVDSVAWHSGNSAGTTHPVARKQPNAFGLYDMSGNVWEWVEDCHDGDCSKRVRCGGSWDSVPVLSSADASVEADPAYRGYGFRLARKLP